MLSSKELEMRFAQRLGLIESKPQITALERREKINRLRRRHQIGEKIKLAYLEITLDNLEASQEFHPEGKEQEEITTPAREIMADDFCKIIGRKILTSFLNTKSV